MDLTNVVYLGLSLLVWFCHEMVWIRSMRGTANLFDVPLSELSRKVLNT